jgi:hypothetical protein
VDQKQNNKKRRFPSLSSTPTSTPKMEDIQQKGGGEGDGNVDNPMDVVQQQQQDQQGGGGDGSKNKRLRTVEELRNMLITNPDEAISLFQHLLAKDEETARIQREKDEENALLKQQLAAATTTLFSTTRIFTPLSNILSGQFSTIKWPIPSTVTLLKATISPSNIYAKSIKKVVATPTEPNVPSLMFHDLDKNERDNQPLKSFPHISGDLPVFLYGPSGAGKTRKIFHFLWHKHGFFIPFKTKGDGKYGSIALSEVLRKIESSPNHNWTAKNIDDTEFENRRKFVHFGVACVLAAYSAIFDQWCKAAKKKPTPSQWLLVQLFPEHYFGDDVFRNISLDLFEHHDPTKLDELKHVGLLARGFPIAIDEAQMIAKMLVNGFKSRSGKTDSFRAMLGPVVSGVTDFASRSPIISGTGLTLVEHRHIKEMVSNMAVMSNTNWICCEFTRFIPKDVQSLIEYCLGDGLPKQELRRVSSLLQGRPRFTTTTIEELVKQNISFDQAYDWILNTFTKKPLVASAVPRTPYESFERLANTPPSLPVGISLNPSTTTTAITTSSSSSSSSFNIPPPASTRVNTAWIDILLEAFLVSAGFEAIVSRNPSLVEFGLGYAISIIVADTYVEVNTTIKFEPLILEAGCNYRNDIMRNEFDLKLVKSVQDMSNAMGSRYEYPVALRLLPALFPDGDVPFESTSLLVQATTLLQQHPDGKYFCGLWKLKPRVNGCFAVQGDGDTFYDWLSDVLPAWKRRGVPSGDAGIGLCFPAESVGPDVGAVVVKGDLVMLIFIQVKLVKTLSDSKIRAAGYTVDPLLFNHTNRSDDTTTTSSSSINNTTKAKPKNVPIKKYEKQQQQFLKCIKDVPVIRILVSGAADIPSEPFIQFVDNGRGGTIQHDLMLNIGPSQLEGVFGNELAKAFRGLKIDD